MSTPAQLAANRANAQFSTGPKTPEGKARISHNAVKTALTGATVLLPTDDVVLYQQHTANAFAAWQPATHRENLLVQSIADAEWRLQRIPALIAGIYALGRLTHSGLFANEPALFQRGEDSTRNEPAFYQRGEDSTTDEPAMRDESATLHQPESVRASLLDAYIYQTYRRDLTNLSLQESRLRRQREKDIAELQELQTERRKRDEARLDAAAEMYQRYQENEETFDPAEFGFEFSMEDIEERVGLFEARRIRCPYPQQFARIHARLLRGERLGKLIQERA